VAKGEVEVGGHRVAAGTMVTLDKNADAVVESLQPSTVMILGGEPVGERLIWWNFVSSSQDRMEQAKADWREGRMKLPDGDDEEFIPLPDEPLPATPPVVSYP
jgi:hypothetical protein